MTDPLESDARTCSGVARLEAHILHVGRNSSPPVLKHYSDWVICLPRCLTVNCVQDLCSRVRPHVRMAVSVCAV